MYDLEDCLFSPTHKKLEFDHFQKNYAQKNPNSQIDGGEVMQLVKVGNDGFKSRVRTPFSLEINWTLFEIFNYLKLYSWCFSDYKACCSPLQIPFVVVVVVSQIFISILAGNLNSSLTYFITTVCLRNSILLPGPKSGYFVTLIDHVGAV